LPSDIRDWAESGNLNPGLLSYVAAFPTAMVAAYDDSHAAFLNKRFLDILAEIKELVENNGGALVVVSMPIGGYFASTISEIIVRAWVSSYRLWTSQKWMKL
jgi:hypothetical protein